MRLRRRLAEWLCPEMALSARCHWKIRNDLLQDRHWLAQEFPHVNAFADRIIQMDDAYAGQPIGLSASKWSHDIGKFREELRRMEVKP